jgi:predicted metalloprotease with PDZ domain
MQQPLCLSGVLSIGQKFKIMKFKNNKGHLILPFQFGSYRLVFLVIFAILIQFLFGSSSKAETGNEFNTISYRITFDKDNLKIAKVEAVFTPKDSILYMSYGANQLPKRWATFVHNVRVANESGKSIEVEELLDAKWKINTAQNEKIILSYEIHLDHQDYRWSGGIDGVAYTTDLGVFYAGRTLLILNGDEWKNINVDFELPKDWGVTTPWNRANEDNYAFKANSVSDLVNALIFAGTHKEVSLIREDFELVFALGSEDIIAQEEEFQNLAEGVLDYYIELMGGIPKPRPDSPFNKAVVVISSYNTTDGEAIGNNISILIEKDGDEFSKTISRFIFAHEFFHLWNGKSFSPIADDTEWFKEGFTNYYTVKALHHVGFLNDESYLDILSNFFYQRYKNDKGVGELSMTDGEAKHDHWGLIYGGGMFVGIAQDIIIRNATNNSKSIDDLFRGLFLKYGGSNEHYSMDELLSTISELSGIDQTEFFNTYVIGTKEIPIAKYLTLAGLSSKVENGNLIISKNDDATSAQQNLIRGFYGQLQGN